VSVLPRICERWRLFLLRRASNPKRIDPDWLDDVLQLLVAEIGDEDVQSGFHLSICVLRKADRARLGDPLESGGDIDALAHQIAVAFLDHVAEMNADAKLDASLPRRTGVALDHTVLDLDCAAHRVHHAAEID
jgi:hypothetical protein